MIFFDTERDFTRWVLATARDLGWIAAHFGNTVKVVRTRKGGYKTIPDKDAVGFPDLVLVRERLIFAELKLDDAKPTAAQLTWIDVLRHAGEEVHVWHPSEQYEIVDTLSGVSAPHRLFSVAREELT